MKIAFAGKGGVGKTTLAAWTGEYLARRGETVWLIDADTALSLGQAAGVAKEDLPAPLISRQDLIEEQIGSGLIHLNPMVTDLAEQLAVEVPGTWVGRQRLLVMGTVTNAGGGCACGANALLKALLAHIITESKEWVLVDLEAGVEHLGRGTVAGVDALVVVTEPSRRGYDTAASISAIAAEMGVRNQFLVLNRQPSRGNLGKPSDLPEAALTVPLMPGLTERQLATPVVTGLPEQAEIDRLLAQLLESIVAGYGQR